MDRRVLVTTAFEDTWPTDGESVLFLGEWCRRYSRRDRWKELDHEVMRYHWDQPEKLYKDYQYLRTTYEEVLAVLSSRMNQIHQVEHDLRYWRILIGPWLIKFIHVLFDRYESVRQVSGYDVISSVVSPDSMRLQPASDTASFTKYLSSDVWNHSIYSTCIRQLDVVESPIIRETTSIEYADASDRLHSPTQRPASAGWKLFNLYNKLAVRLSRRTDVVMYSTYLHPIDELRLCLELAQFPCVRPTASKPSGVGSYSVAANSSFRDWKLPEIREAPFRKMLSSEIPKHIPTIFLEGYSDLESHVDDLPLPATPSAIWTSNAHFSDDVFNAWAGSKVEEGCPLLVGQHGGVFGLARFSPPEDHEREICDFSLTWGWSEDNDHCYVPVGHFPRPNRPLGVDHSSKSTGLLVSQVVLPNAFEAVAGIVASQWCSYFDFQCQILEALPDDICQNFTVRTAPEDPGWNQSERWRARMPSVNVDDGSSRLKNLFLDARLCIATGNCTVFQEAFLMQIPTLLIWNPVHWEIRDSAQHAFRGLQEAGVFFADPVLAARHITAIWQDTGAWWHSAKVQSAVDHFNASYNWAPDGVVSRIRGAIVKASLPRESTPGR